MVLDKRDATNYRRSEDIAKQGDLDKELNKKLKETEADNEDYARKKGREQADIEEDNRRPRFMNQNDELTGKGIT